MSDDDWAFLVAEKGAIGGVICGGELYVKVEAEESPYYGGMSAELSVEVRCLKCKYETNKVVTIQNVEQILTEYVQKL